MSNPPPEWSLSDEVKKRKTQATLRALESKIVQTPPLTNTQKSTARQPVALPPSERARYIPRALSEVKRTTQGNGVIASSTRWTRHQKRVVLVATSVIVAVCTLAILIVSKQSLQQSVLVPLPIADTAGTVRYLKEVGVPITDVQVFAMPNTQWNAREEIQFVIPYHNQKGIFVMLTYPSPALAGIDAFKATYQVKFADWKLVQISNILVLSSPETSQSLSNELMDHLSHYLLVPYRSFVPTSTPKH
jgi:hypothetical protein